MNLVQPSTVTHLFKAIALFTPGGDLVYCIDPNKQRRWHSHLCTSLQELLGLPEPPHFLIPCYTATYDRWVDPQTQQIQLSAEAYPPVLQYQTLLNTIFDTGDIVWQPATGSEEFCNPLIIATYYQQFPQLWENHDLIVQVKKNDVTHDSTTTENLSEYPSPNFKLDLSPEAEFPETKGYVLRLFVSGHSLVTEKTLQTLHQLLERSIGHPYTLKVIDVLKHPDLAEADQISATPTLVKVWPKPVRRIVGELNNVDTILRLLGSPADTLPWEK
ncbi:circadian clock KaiB family protein [Planktothrix mougeotii]|uniref:Circadian clock KaiB family protein n=1 Tax=Planktothrix mougeotii LEGE 06226 TaxID=1828728 RepID=A0ABR9UI73_9CYAN|nr:circadian clock KaiB family protein [Planktothrix mougeotii]MBE9146148.1 circadian clock KaiB family protein [Planktothrix mougeotii LEGE 06226]